MRITRLPVVDVWPVAVAIAAVAGAALGCAKRGSPAAESSKAAKPGPASSKYGPASVKYGPGFAKHGPAAEKYGPAFARSGPGSAKSGPASATYGPASAKPRPASPKSGPAAQPAPTFGYDPPPPAVAGKVQLTLLTSGAAEPVGIVAAPGDPAGRLFVIEKAGRIRILRGTTLAATPFLDLSAKVAYQPGDAHQGLLGLAFHPQYRKNGRFFINFTDKQGDTRVVEMRADRKNRDRADTGALRELLFVDQPDVKNNGGHLTFGPDGKLYVLLGDGGPDFDPQRAAQNPKTLLGKMLRLDPDSPNPKAEVLGQGLRNPWRYSFDGKTGDLYIADVGQEAREWVHVVPKGAIDTFHNFGWNITEGSRCFGKATCDRKGITAPVLEYTHKEGCAITGGHAYRGKALPELDGVYFYSDYCTALLRSFRLKNGRAVEKWDWKNVLDPESKLAKIVGFSEDQDRELYLVSHEGSLYKLTARPAGKTAAAPPLPANRATAAAPTRGQSAIPIQSLTIWSAQGAQADWLEEMSRDFGDKRNVGCEKTDVEVKVHQIPRESLGDQVFQEFGNNETAFDIVMGDSEWLGRGATEGLYLDLSQWLPKAVDLKTLHPLALKVLAEYPTGSGKYFAAPCTTDPVGFAYRKDWFEDATSKEAFKKKFKKDLTVPQTWDDLEEVARFFTKPGQKHYGVQLMAAANGRHLVKRLAKYAPPNGNRSGPGEEGPETFTNGSTALVMSTFAHFPELSKSLGERVGFFAMPTSADKQGERRLASLGGQGCAISTKVPSARQELAKKFIVWFLQRETQENWVKRPSGFPVNADILKSDEFKRSRPYNEAFSQSMDGLVHFWKVPAVATRARLN